MIIAPCLEFRKKIKNPFPGFRTRVFINEQFKTGIEVWTNKEKKTTQTKMMDRKNSNKKFFYLTCRLDKKKEFLKKK